MGTFDSKWTAKGGERRPFPVVYYTVEARGQIHQVMTNCASVDWRAHYGKADGTSGLPAQLLAKRNKYHSRLYHHVGFLVLPEFTGQRGKSRSYPLRFGPAWSGVNSALALYVGTF